MSGSPCPAGADYVGDILSRKLPDIPVPVIAVGVDFVIIDIQERVGENNYGGLKAQPTVPLLVQLVPVLFPGRMEAAVLNVIPLCFPMLCSSLSASHSNVIRPSALSSPYPNMRVAKISPRECMQRNSPCIKSEKDFRRPKTRQKRLVLGLQCARAKLLPFLNCARIIGILGA